MSKLRRRTTEALVLLIAILGTTFDAGAGPNDDPRCDNLSAANPCAAALVSQVGALHKGLCM